MSKPRGHKFQIRAAMRDGHPPGRAVRIANEMHRISSSSDDAEQGPTPQMDLGDPADSTVDAMASGGVGDLTAESRKRMKASTFGLPGERKYPMPDKAHARNAKARASEFATPSQRKRIDAKANRILGE